MDKVSLNIIMERNLKVSGKMEEKKEMVNIFIKMEELSMAFGKMVKRLTDYN